MSPLPTAGNSLARTANWAVGLAAATLVLISVAGYFYCRGQLAAIGAEHLRLIVTGPSRLQAGTAATYTVSTRSISGGPLPAEIEVILESPDGSRLKAYKETADEHGLLQVVIPAGLELPARTRLNVVARRRESCERAEAILAVEPDRDVACLAIDRPLYRPGETVRYRSLTLSRFRLTAGRATPVHFEIRGSSGAVVPGSPRDVLSDRGVAAGAFVIPDELAAGQYTLIARSLDDAFPPSSRTFLVSSHRLARAGEESAAAPKNVAKTASPDAGKLDVAFYPEGGELAAGLENRVYFVARGPSGEPVRLTGAIVGKAAGAGGREQLFAAVETTSEGRGVFTIVPRAGQTYQLRITSPSGISVQPKLPEASPENHVVLSANPGVFAAGAPLKVRLRTDKAGLPLVAAAYCRGVQVGQQALVSGGDAADNLVTIPLDEAAGGVIRLVVYDYSFAPPKPVAERLVYRGPGWKLNVQATPDRKQYAPGQQVQMSLVVTDEQGRPVPAVLGVSVVDEALLKSADGPAVAMPAEFLLTGDIDGPAALGDAGDELADGSLDLLLGTQRGRPGEAPPLMYDNLEQIRSNYEKFLADYQADRTAALNTLTVSSFFGGLGLVLLVAMLGLVRIVSGMHLWIAAIGATTCCLIIGAILMDPGRLAPAQDLAVPFRGYQSPPQKAEKSPELPSAGPPRERQNQPASDGSAESPFWNPMLVAGPDGKASLRFDLPSAPAAFRVTIDAHGDGRLGSRRLEIRSAQ